MTTVIGSDPVLIDSSGWLEYITADTKADLFAPYIEGRRAIIVSTIVLYEVRKILLLRQPRTLADQFVSAVMRHFLVSVDENIAVAGAAISIQHHLSIADALLYATAERLGAELVTSDAHFRGLQRVTLI